jgi:hypothetical protein
VGQLLQGIARLLCGDLDGGDASLEVVGFVVITQQDERVRARAGAQDMTVAARRH